VEYSTSGSIRRVKGGGKREEMMKYHGEKRDDCVLSGLTWVGGLKKVDPELLREEGGNGGLLGRSGLSKTHRTLPFLYKGGYHLGRVCNLMIKNALTSRPWSGARNTSDSDSSEVHR